MPRELYLGLYTEAKSILWRKSVALLTTGHVSHSGVVQSLVAAAGGGDTLSAGERTFLVVNNGSGGSINVTVASPTTCSQGSTHPLVVAVGAGAVKYIGPLPENRFGDPVSVTYSAVTSVTVGVFTS